MRKAAIIYDDDGKIVRKKWGEENGVVQTAENSGFNFIYFDELPDTEGKYVDNGELADMPPQPSEFCNFDYPSKQWVESLESAKNAKWNEIKHERSGEEFGSFGWGDYTFDCDEISQRRIQGAVQLSALDPSTVMDWTLEDNTVQTLNATELQQIGQALASHVNACHVKARDLRDQINAAQTEAELSVISW